MTVDEILETMDQASPEMLKIMILLLVLEQKSREIPSGYPPNVSMAEMATRWATWGIGPKVYP